MSIVRQLIQLSIVEALRGRTIAGNAVFDSRMDTLPDLLVDQHQPVIIVSVEASDRRNMSQGIASLLGGSTVLTVLIQTAVATGRAIKGPDGTVIRAAIGETDSAFEGALNLLDHEWRKVLHHFENEWAEVFRDLVNGVQDIKDTRGTDPDTKRKHAARFVQLDLSVLAEPEPGDDLPEVIARGLDLMSADADYAPLAEEWRTLLAEGSDWPEWRKLQSALLASRQHMATIGQGPLIVDEEVDFEIARLNVSGVSTVEILDDP